MTGESYPRIHRRELADADPVAIREALEWAFASPGFFVLELDSDGTACDCALDRSKQFMALPEEIKLSQRRSVPVDGCRPGRSRGFCVIVTDARHERLTHR